METTIGAGTNGMGEALKADSPFHGAMLAHCKDLMKMSRSHMSKNYPKWDAFDDSYKGFKYQDKDDKLAANRKEPEKMVVPLTYAQVQTFVAFCWSLYTQREYFFETVGYSPEDENSADLGEALLQQNLDYNQFNTQLYQFLLNVAKFGFGAFKCYWHEESQQVTTTTPGKSLNMFGMKIPMSKPKTETTSQLKYQGNKIINVSPYRFFPDPRFPISRFQEGEFCGSEDTMGYSTLKQLESEGACFNVDHIKTMSVGEDEGRDRIQNSRITGMDVAKSSVEQRPIGQSKGTVLLSEIQVKIVPSKFELSPGVPLGKEEFPVKYLVWIANDTQIVRCEPLNYVHDRFTYEIAEFATDMNHFLNNGLCEQVDMLQQSISWFINSHITSVRKIIQNFLVVDPDGVNLDDIKQRRSVIRLQPGFGRNGGVERWIKQLNVQDVTQNHMQDAELLQRLMQTVTGINETLLGQFHSGRRSATEARAVSSSASARLKMLASIIFTSALEPLGRQMLSNLRNGLTIEVYVRTFGSAVDGGKFESFKKVGAPDLAGNFDFSVFDGTLPSEKGYLADTLKEVVMGLLGNPESIPLIGLDPKAMLYEMLKLKGIRYPQRFAIGATGVLPQSMQQPPGQPGQPQQPGQPNGQPAPGSNPGFQPSGLPFARESGQAPAPPVMGQ